MHADNENLYQEKLTRDAISKAQERDDDRVRFNQLGNGYDRQRQFLEKSNANGKLNEGQYLRAVGSPEK